MYINPIECIDECKIGKNNFEINLGHSEFFIVLYRSVEVLQFKRGEKLLLGIDSNKYFGNTEQDEVYSRLTIGRFIDILKTIPELNMYWCTHCLKPYPDGAVNPNIPVRCIHCRTEIMQYIPGFKHKQEDTDMSDKPPLIHIFGELRRCLLKDKPKLPDKKGDVLKIKLAPNINFLIEKLRDNEYATCIDSKKNGTSKRGWLIKKKDPTCMDLLDALEKEGRYNILQCTNCFYKLDPRTPYCDNCNNGKVNIKCQHDYNIHDYNYMPSSHRFYIANKEKISPYHMGIELEVDAGYKWVNHQLTTSKIADIACGWLYFKRDGSLKNGFEIVTQPLSFDFIKEKESDIKSILDVCIKDGYTSFHNNTCGMHIHVSRCGVHALQIPIMYKLLQENKNITNKLICRRKFKDTKRWCNYQIQPHSIERKSQRYCANQSDDDKYSAINVNKRSTVEFRIFKGTLGYNGFMSNIETVHSLIEYTKAISLNDVCINGWYDFIKSKETMYPYLNRKLFNSKLLVKA